MRAPEGSARRPTIREVAAVAGVSVSTAARAVNGKTTVDPELASKVRGSGAGVLGGTNLAISQYSKNPGGALALMNFFTGEVGQRLIGEGATPPDTIAAYDVESVRKALGLPDEIRDAVGKAMPRPVSPVYPQISQAIYKNVNQALSGEQSTDDAVANMFRDVEKALATF